MISKCELIDLTLHKLTYYYCLSTELLMYHGNCVHFDNFQVCIQCCRCLGVGLFGRIILSVRRVKTQFN